MVNWNSLDYWYKMKSLPLRWRHPSGGDKSVYEWVWADHQSNNVVVPVDDAVPGTPKEMSPCYQYADTGTK